jgi:hypothetical protein
MAKADGSESADLITHEEVEHWSVEALKDYCRNRGYKVTWSKKELVSRVYFLYNNQVPEQQTIKQQELSRKKDYKELVSSRYPTPDPANIKKWTSEKEGVKLWPPVTYIDIHWFLKNNGSTGLSQEDLTAYKTGKAYSYFSCDWLQEIFYSAVNKTSECCFVKAKCTPSTRVNDEPHLLWIKIVKKTGEIISAYCTCVAG